MNQEKHTKILWRKYNICEALAVQLPHNRLFQYEEWHCRSQALGIYVQASAIRKEINVKKKKKKYWITGLSPAILMLGQHYQLSPCSIFMSRHKIIELKYRSAITNSHSKYHSRKGYLIKAGKPEAWRSMLAGLQYTDRGTRFKYTYVHTHTFTHKHISLANQYY